MKKSFWFGWLVLMAIGIGWLSGQTAPQLSTSDKVALQSLEQIKSESRKKYEDAQQAETVIIREWQAAHPGWTVNQQTFAVEPEKKAEEPKK